MAKAVVTSKGQVTIPKIIRDRARIDKGTQLDFQLEPDGSVIIRPVIRDISEIKGMVKTKRRKPVTLKEMKRAIAKGAKERAK
jgi:antitoxin PrlF